MELAVAPRDTTQKLKALRKQYIIPGVIYGKELNESVSIQFDKNAFTSLYREAGYSTPINLTVDGETHLALIKEIDVDPVLDMLRHVSFHAVNANEEVEAEVALTFVGESPLIAEGEFKTEIVRDAVVVAALPRDLPSEIVVDLATVVEPGDIIHVSDLTVADTVTIKDDPELAIVTTSKVAAAVEEEEVAETPEEDGEATDDS